jgi:hypothetical protein
MRPSLHATATSAGATSLPQVPFCRRRTVIHGEASPGTTRTLIHAIQGHIMLITSNFTMPRQRSWLGCQFTNSNKLWCRHCRSAALLTSGVLVRLLTGQRRRLDGARAADTRGRASAGEGGCRLPAQKAATGQGGEQQGCTPCGFRRRGDHGGRDGGIDLSQSCPSVTWKR